MQNVVEHDGIISAPAVAASLVGARGADIADVLDTHDAAEAAAIVAHLPPDESVKAFDQPVIGAAGIVALLPRVTFGSFLGSMLPFDPAVASAPFVATLVDVTGLVILHGTLL